MSTQRADSIIVVNYSVYLFVARAHFQHNYVRRLQIVLAGRKKKNNKHGELQTVNTFLKPISKKREKLPISLAFRSIDFKELESTVR